MTNTFEYEVTGISQSIATVNDICDYGWPVGLEKRVYSYPKTTIDLPKPEINNTIAKDIVYVDDGIIRSYNNGFDSELAAIKLWEINGRRKIEVDDIIKVAFLLVGAWKLRDRDIFSHEFSSGHRIKFVEAIMVPERMESLLDKLNDEKCHIHPALMAIGIMFEFLVIHPFENGNGRIARLIYQFALHKYGNLYKPILPLGHIISNNMEVFLFTSFSWYFDNKPDGFIKYICLATSITSDIVKKIADNK